MATAYNMVIGASLGVLLALLAGMCLAGAWRHLTRGGLIEGETRTIAEQPGLFEMENGGAS